MGGRAPSASNALDRGAARSSTFATQQGNMELGAPPMYAPARPLHVTRSKLVCRCRPPVGGGHPALFPRNQVAQEGTRPDGGGNIHRNSLRPLKSRNGSPPPERAAERPAASPSGAAIA